MTVMHTNNILMSQLVMVAMVTVEFSIEYNKYNKYSRMSHGKFFPGIQVWLGSIMFFAYFLGRTK